jgi:cysteine dioxygenase
MTELSHGVSITHDRRARNARPVDRDLSGAPPDSVLPVLALLRPPGTSDVDAIARALRALNVDIDTLGDAVCEDDAHYVRTLLYRDERAEMLVLTWRPGQHSPTHSHGASTCIVRIVEGVATEHLYRADERLEAEQRYLSRKLDAGTVTQTPGDIIHALGNEQRDVLVTLHVYAPPLKRD